MGEGHFTNDLQCDGVLSPYLLRSPYVSAEFRIISTEAAKVAPGVRLILIAVDMEATPSKVWEAIPKAETA